MSAERHTILRAHYVGQCVAQTRRRWRDLNAGGFHGRNLAFCIAPAAGDDGAGMAHAAARRRGATGNEPYRGLFTAAFGFVGKKLRGISSAKPPISPIITIASVA